MYWHVYKKYIADKNVASDDATFNTFNIKCFSLAWMLLFVNTSVRNSWSITASFQNVNETTTFISKNGLFINASATTSFQNVNVTTALVCTSGLFVMHLSSKNASLRTWMFLFFWGCTNGRFINASVTSLSWVTASFTYVDVSNTFICTNGSFLNTLATSLSSVTACFSDMDGTDI